MILESDACSAMLDYRKGLSRVGGKAPSAADGDSSRRSGKSMVSNCENPRSLGFYFEARLRVMG